MWHLNNELHPSVCQLQCAECIGLYSFSVVFALITKQVKLIVLYGMFTTEITIVLIFLYLENWSEYEFKKHLTVNLKNFHVWELPCTSHEI